MIGRVTAGIWASNVAGSLTAEMRIGAAPGESLDAVEDVFRDRLETATEADGWLREHPPRFEHFGVQFEATEVDPDEPIVRALRRTLSGGSGEPVEVTGETYGTDARHLIAAGIPMVIWGPGQIEEAHFPDESIRWPDVVQSAEVLSDVSRRFLDAEGTS